MKIEYFLLEFPTIYFIGEPNLFYRSVELSRLKEETYD